MVLCSADSLAARAIHKTKAGVPLPQGWTLKQGSYFGTGKSANVKNFAQLHARYFEGMFYNRNAKGLVNIPNFVVNNEQQTYSHFEKVIAFSPDHLTIQAHGHPDGSITSGEMVSKWTSRSFCAEGRYQIPDVAGSWPAFWVFSSKHGSLSELDVEQPIGGHNTPHTVTMDNYPSAPNAKLTKSDPLFSTAKMTWANSAFNASKAPHVYTICYDDSGKGTVSRYIDGKHIYTISPWKWNANLGGTGHGPDATSIFNLAVGGGLPGNVANPSAFKADLKLYSLEYYGP